MIKRRTFGLAITCAIAAQQVPAIAQSMLNPTPARQSPVATSAQILGAARAGQRIVAVGDHGVVLLSDDNGSSFRQAKGVPVSSPLTSVTFVDAQHGWAVGQWGTILVTLDGGETWRIQRQETSADRPLFGVHFFDATHGVAVGLWSLILSTTDGGSTWSPQSIAPMPGAQKADLNLLSLFPGQNETIYATAEKGQLLVSHDRGQVWAYINTGYKGSLWCGAQLPDGTVLVGGQRGTLLKQQPGQVAWQRIEVAGTGSLTSVALSGQKVLVVGLDGTIIASEDGALHTTESKQADAASLTVAIWSAQNKPIFFSRSGFVKAAQTP